MLKVAPTAKVGVAHDGLARGFIKSDILRGELHGRSNNHAMTKTRWIFQCPTHGLHTTEAAANDCCPYLNAELVRQTCLTFYPVAYPQFRKIRTPGLAGFRIYAARTSRAVTPAQIIQRHHKKFIGINRFAWTYIA